MSLSSINTTRDLRTHNELLELVEAIYKSPPTAQETNWLEWKSTLDLSTPEGRFTVAKAILGFANRSVEQAQLKCAGVAYMIVGVEPGSTPGVNPVDHAILTQRIATYVDSPRWTPQYIPFSNVQVLVVMVEPPRVGDTIHTLEKEFSNNKTRHRAGTIFHRAAAHTEPAGPKEVRMLLERALRGAREPELDLDLEAATEPLPRVTLSRAQIADWLSRHERYVRANSGAPPPPTPPPPREPRTPTERLLGLSGLSGEIGSSLLGSIFTNTRDEEEYDRRVATYLTKMRRSLPKNIIKSIVRSGDKNKVYFTVSNLTDDPVAGVQFTVTIPRHDLLVFTCPPSVDQLPQRPKWPDQFRDRMTQMPSLALPHDFNFSPHSGSVSKTTETYEITWDVGDLQPRISSRDLEITVVPGPKAPNQVEITMAASAMNRRGRRTEATTLTISQDNWTPDDFYMAEPD